jgi:competence protein ComEC
MLLAAYYILKDYKRKARYAVLFTAAFALSSGISAVSHIGTTDFTFVNVGQGDGSVIHTALGASVIIDGGGGTAYSDYNPGESIFVPYLESHGCSEIDAAFVSHFHRDHVQGVIAAVKTLNVKNLFLPPLTDSCGDDMKALAAELEEIAKSRGTNICYVTEDTRITFKRGLTIDIYVPDEVIRLSKDENDTSLLIKASYNDTSVLYTGDMSLYGEKEYMRIGTNVRADVLKVGHHGSKTSTCTEWINAVAPTYSVISCGENNSFGHPAQDTLNRLDSTSILRTDLNGDIKITVNKNGIKHLTLFKQ